MATLGWNIKTTSKKQNTNCFCTIGKHSNPPSYKQLRHSLHKHKETLKKSKQRLYVQHHQRASKHQTLMHKETTPRFRSYQTLWGKLGQKWEVSDYDFGDDLCQHNDFFKAAAHVPICQKNLTTPEPR